MHNFALVHLPRGRHLPPHVADLLHSSQPADLPFRAEGNLHWSSNDGSVQFGGWHAGGEQLGRGSYWDVRADGLTAFAGTPWLDSRPWAEWVPWASQIADHLFGSAHPSAPSAVRSLLSRCSGCFAIAGIDADGIGAVGAGALGLHVLYTATAGDLTVVSNRAALAARIIAGPEGRPVRDTEGAAWIAYAGSVMDDRTSFRDVRVLPVGSTVSFGPTGEPEIRPGHTTPWLNPSLHLDPLDPASYEAAVADLRSNVRLGLSVHAWKHDLELTGGKDSRMILGLLLADERAHDVSYLTWGASDLPDVVVANALADRFDLDLQASGRRRGRSSHEPQEPPQDPGSGHPAILTAAVAEVAGPPEPAAPVGPDPPPLPDLPSGSYDALIRRHLWLTSGAVNVWEAYDRYRLPNPHLSITGLTGEVLRTNYASSNEVRTREQLALFVDAGGLGHDRAGLLRPDASRHLRRRVDEDLDMLFALTGDARDAIDGYYQIGRLRRWFGVGNELDNRNRTLPLYSLTAFQTAFAIGADHRRAERLAFEVLSATVPELTTIPFANRGWSPRLTSSLPNPERFPTTPDPQLPHPANAPDRTPRKIRPWRRRSRPSGERPTVERRVPTTLVDAREFEAMESRIPVLREYLDLGPRHALYDFLDYEATMRAVGELAELDIPASKAVFGAATAAMWLTDADMPLYLDG